MELTNKQMEGLKIALKRYQDNEKCTIISGYAGSGKSTLVKFIVSALPVTEDEVCYATFTGKAAQVLLKKGNKNVSTLHKLLYKSIPQKDGTYMRIPVPEIDYRIVIVDECSMAPKELVNLLLTHRCYVIFLGDPGQLPPINPADDNHLLDTPHVFLDEIMRQAQESEIIRLSMDIRAGKPLELFNGNDVKVIDPEDLVNGMYTWADQIICAKNETRVAINNEMREMLGKEGAPQDGDKIICLKNYWHCLADNEDPLINGTLGYLSNPYETFVRYPYFIQGGGTVPLIRGMFISDSGSKLKFIYHNIV
jgi:exodeoxyribonuclease-5